MRYSLQVIVKDVVWIRVLSLSVILFFILLSDATISFWVPNFIEEKFSSSLIMGLIMSFSSLVGLLADLVLPQIFKGVTVKRLIVLAALVSFGFIGFLMFSVYKVFLVLILAAMAFWGINYEFLGFGQQQFVADSVPLKLHSSVWGLLHVFRSLAYFFGPLIAGLLIRTNTQMPLIFALCLLVVGFVLLLLTGKRHERPMEFSMHEVNIWREVGHWRALFVHVWPIVLVSLYLGLIDATFWTTGAVWTESLSKVHPWGGFILPSFVLPSIFMGFVVAKWQIFHGKKKLSELFLLITGVSLVLLMGISSVPAIILIVFCAGIMSAIAFPLIDGVYSDIISRMGRERRHLIGLSRSTISIAYIIGPTVAGLMASYMGEKLTIAYIGAGAIIISVILLLTTPKKLKLPQEEIKTWE